MHKTNLSHVNFTCHAGATKNSATVTVSVALTDVNDNAPTCSQSVYSSTLPENSAVSTAGLLPDQLI